MEEKNAVAEISARAFIESVTTDKKLRSVLAGNTMLYVLQADKTPLYVHALILNSYIESSWKFIDGGSAIAKLLAKNIRAKDGVIHKNAEVVKIITDNEKAIAVQLKEGSKIYGKNFISNMHPQQTLQLTDSSLIKNAYKHRINNLENSIGGFVVNIVFKKDSFKYIQHNYYYHKDGHVWNLANHNEANWPLCYALFFSASSRSQEYASSMTILTYMRYDEVKEWASTFNTVSNEDNRGDKYEAFKKHKAAKLIKLVEQKFPQISECIQSYYTATPLSFRDYIGTSDGSMYGVVKDYKNPIQSFISPRTKIPNLYLTGQNLNLHGILGAAMSGLLTSTVFLGSEDIIKKISNA